MTHIPDETWLDLEKLAALIFSELEPSQRVTHNASIVGSLSRVPRQIDVLIEDPATGAMVVVDCKDWNKKVNVSDAGAFASLLEDVQATAGVLLCNRGFSAAARNLARAKGFALAGLHDAESRKWRLDVLIPVIWTRLALLDLGVGAKVRLEAGDEVDTTRFRFLRNGEEVDVAGFFETAWNEGRLHLGEPGSGMLSAVLDYEISEGVIRKDAEVEIRYTVSGNSVLGRVTPQDARGIFDESTKSFTTVHFDVGKTLNQEPEAGWSAIADPREVALRLAGTVVTMEETSGVTVAFGGIRDLVGAEDHNRHFRWSSGSQTGAPQAPHLLNDRDDRGS